MDSNDIAAAQRRVAEWLEPEPKWDLRGDIGRYSLRGLWLYCGGVDPEPAPLDGHFAAAVIEAMYARGWRHFVLEMGYDIETGRTVRATFAQSERIRAMGMDGSGAPLDGIDYFDSPVQETNPSIATVLAADAVRARSCLVRQELYGGQEQGE